MHNSQKYYVWTLWDRIYFIKIAIQYGEWVHHNQSICVYREDRDWALSLPQMYRKQNKLN